MLVLPSLFSVDTGIAAMKLAWIFGNASYCKWKCTVLHHSLKINKFDELSAVLPVIACGFPNIARDFSKKVERSKNQCRVIHYENIKRLMTCFSCAASILGEGAKVFRRSIFATSLQMHIHTLEFQRNNFVWHARFHIRMSLVLLVTIRHIRHALWIFNKGKQH